MKHGHVNANKNTTNVHRYNSKFKS